MNKVAILGGQRTPFARAGTSFSSETNLTLLSATLKSLVKKFQLEGEVLGDVAAGAVINQSRDWNLAREALFQSGLSHETPAYGVMRACATSLESAIGIANKISLGQISSGIAAGVDSMSDVPVFFQPKFAKRILALSKAKGLLDQLKVFTGMSLSELKPAYPAVTESLTGLSMGQSCEVMAKTWSIERAEQDQLALKSHQNAAEAYEKGVMKDQIFSHCGLNKDNNLRADTTLEKLAKLRPAFEKTGTLTAGNSSALTDGASAVLLSDDSWAQKRGLKILAHLEDCQTAAVDFRNNREGLLMAPTYAVARMLQRRGEKLQDFDYYEIHEAFAAQVLCTLRAWNDPTFCKEKLNLNQVLGEIDHQCLNVWGGSVALGHPFGATGARVLLTAAQLVNQKPKSRALISICTGGGMGVAAIVKSSH